MLVGGVDQNGDGYADLTIGTWGEQVFLFAGGSAGVDTTPTTINLQIAGPAQRDFISSAGDVNGDGYSDLITSESDDYATYALINVYGGSASGLLSSPILTASRAGDYDAGPGAGVYYHATGISDVDGDHLADILVTMPTLSTALLYSGSSTGILASPTNLANDAGPADDFGIAVFGTTN